jgi:hypothetical protein
VAVESHSFLTVILNENELSASRLGHFTRGTHFVGSRVHPDSHLSSTWAIYISGTAVLFVSRLEKVY